MNGAHITLKSNDRLDGLRHGRVVQALNIFRSIMQCDLTSEECAAIGTDFERHEFQFHAFDHSRAGISDRCEPFAQALAATPRSVNKSRRPRRVR